MPAMNQMLIIADPRDTKQHAIARGLRLAALAGAEARVVAFVHENLAALPQALTEPEQAQFRQKVLEKTQTWLDGTIAAANGADTPVRSEVVWERHIAAWVVREAKTGAFDFVVKTGHRSETWLHTPTDWELIRSCPTPLLLVAGQRWRGGQHVIASVDLGTRMRAKQALNRKVASMAADMARLLQRELHFAYAPPITLAMRELDLVDKRALRDSGRALMTDFVDALSQEDIVPDDVHVKAGPPDKVLTQMAAKCKADLVVIGSIGRKALVGKLIGNTAEQVLRLTKADILVVKP